MVVNLMFLAPFRSPVGISASGRERRVGDRPMDRRREYPELEDCEPYQS